MTFSVMLEKDNQPRVVGILWASDQANAETIAPIMCGFTQGERIHLRRTDDREIPLRLAASDQTEFC